MLQPDTSILEDERIKELYGYQVLDTIGEQEYDDITFLASQICDTPIALISLIDRDRQWFKSKLGLDISETDRNIALCSYTIREPDDILIITDTREDERFKNNPLVKRAPNVVFYTGICLKNSNGFALGTLCVIDHKPRSLDKNQIKSLEALANQVVRLLELRKSRTTLSYCNFELEKKNSNLEQFAFIAAHDIKSPLNSISSTINFLMADESMGLTDEARHAIKPIDNSARQLRNLVDGILEYSKSDKLLLQRKEHFDFSKLVQNIVELLDVRLNCSFIYNKEQTPIFANKTALQQILINLVSNALKYNDKPEVIIEIDMVESKNHYCFFVRDNGAGIKKEDQLRIFELFEVLSIASDVKLDNSGIGLATVKRLVDGLGGIITVESIPKKGSKFEFTIEK